MNKKLIFIIAVAVIAILILLSQNVFAQASLQQPVNYSVLNSKTVDFNFSAAANITAVNYTYTLSIGLSNGTVLANKTLANDTATHFYNTTVLQIDSGWGLYHNWTIYEFENVGNTTKTSIGYFKVDSTKANMSAPTFTLANKSTGGNYLNITANISDLNPSGCKATLYYTSGTIRNATSGEVKYNTSFNNTVCMVNITPSDIAEDGKADAVIMAKDQAGNENYSENQTYIFYRLKTGWNLITGYENKTVSQIASEFTNVTYVSLWDNINKRFWTYTVGGATNASMGANFSSNFSAGAAWVYVNADVVSMRRYYTVPTNWQNVSLFHNTSANLTTWNIIGVTKYMTNLSDEVQKNLCMNFTGTVVGTNCANITWVSFWSAADQKFCTFYRGRLSTSCSLTADAYNLTSGDALLIAVQPGVNMTLNRTGW